MTDGLLPCLPTSPSYQETGSGSDAKKTGTDSFLNLGLQNKGFGTLSCGDYVSANEEENEKQECF